MQIPCSDPCPDFQPEEVAQEPASQSVLFHSQAWEAVVWRLDDLGFDIFQVQVLYLNYSAPGMEQVLDAYLLNKLIEMMKARLIKKQNII